MRRAIGQRVAREEVRKANLLQSTFRARAAASGADLSDPSLVNAQAEIAAAGEYNKLSRIFEADVAAQSDEDEAKVAYDRGQAAQINSIIDTGKSFYGAYG